MDEFPSTDSRKPTEYVPRAPTKLTSEDYAAEALAADLDEWIIYDPNESFEEWLENNRPSNISREDHVGWICVRAKIEDDEPKDLVGLQKAWTDLVESKAPITFERICTLALGYNVTVGKWLFHVETGYKVDLLWKIIATQIITGTLGEYAISAKVSPINAYWDKSHHVICVYNRNFTNEAEVLALEKEIRKAGIKCPMKYKPDVYTNCGIYVNNPWEIRPSIYASEYDVRAHCSKIENLQTREKFKVEIPKKES